MIYGYPEVASVEAGTQVALRVATDAPRFRVRFHRCGAAFEHVGTSGWLEGERRPPHLPFQDWGLDNTGLDGQHLPAWPSYEFAVPSDWRSGVYVAVLEEGVPAGDDGTGPDARSGRALFVVRPAPGRPQAPILYKLPLFTYHAYNQAVPAHGAGRGSEATDAWSLYTIPADDRLPAPVPPAVSLRRPGGGTGGTPSDHWNVDPFDPTPRQTFVHWDRPAIRWLESRGYDLDYCTDLDLHGVGGPALLRGYPLMLSVGHDEYWSDPMRDAVERFVDIGGNVAFFGGNTCWFRIGFDDDSSFRRAGNWSDHPDPWRPENALTGVSYRNGGERGLHDGLRPVGYRVQDAGHWVYEGTGLTDGDTFGAGAGEHLVGYECDGALFDPADLARGVPVRPTGDDGTPTDFTILGLGDVAASGWGLGNRVATMGLHSGRGGTVFTAATTDWARILASDSSPAVDRITDNVIRRLSRS